MIGYPLRRKNTNEKLGRKFVDSNNRIAPEHAQKFIYSINLKDTNFNVLQKIGEVAKRGEMIFNIELIND